MEDTEPTRTLKELLSSQMLAALATQSNGQPYNCLVAIAPTEDLKHLLFSTFRHTRKYREIQADSRVSILVDSRSNSESDFSDAMAVTATGRAVEADESERERLLEIYLARHPHLVDFAGSPDSALVRIDVEEYILSSFQKVQKLKID